MKRIQSLRLNTKAVFISFIAIFTCSINMYAQENPISQTPFAILDLSSDTSLSSLNTLINTNRWGLRCELLEEDSQLLIKKHNSRIPFIEFLKLLKERINNPEVSYFPLIISFPGDLSKVDSLIDKLALGSHVITDEMLARDQSTLWYDQQGSDILILSENHSVGSSKYVIPYKKYFNTGQNSDPVFSSYMFTEFVNSSEKPLFSSLKLGNESSFLKIVVNDWKQKGCFPMFILVDNYNFAFRSLSLALENFQQVSGTILSVDGERPLIYFDEFSKSKILSEFCFPVENVNTFSLTPYSPGYVYSPSKFVINAKSSKKQLQFQPAQIELTQNLKAYYKFDGSTRDQLLLNHGITNYGAEFIEDPVRDEVIEFTYGDFVELPPVKNFNLHDHDFTISSWVYLRGDYEYQAILCNTENFFRKGLQFAVRDSLPYMGFWHIDLRGRSHIEPGTWNHLVCVYNRHLERMQIFLNGKLDAEAFDFLSFTGSVDKKLFIGKNPVGYQFNGMLDDLIIWDRTLADFEVKTIYEKGFVGENIIGYWWRQKYVKTGIVLLLVLILGFISFKGYLAYRAKKKSSLQNRHDNLPFQLKINLFGEFAIADNKGKNYTDLFTPKIRNLFIVVLYYSTMKDKKGIDTVELSELVWPEIPHSNALNNRRVATKRLKEVLGEIKGLELVIVNNKLQLTFDDEVYIDLVAYRSIKESNDFNRIDELIQVLSNGVFLQKIEKPWADEIKPTIINEIIEFISGLVSNNEIKDADKVALLDILLLNDPVDEFAAKKKIELLLKAGKDKPAELVYKKFCKDYKAFFNEDYKENLL